jgi:hypothetical protein
MVFNIEISQPFSARIQNCRISEQSDGGESGIAKKTLGGHILQNSAEPTATDKEATRDEQEMVKVVECLQGVYGFKSKADCQWALLPPSAVDGFVSGEIWAMARLGATSDVREVEKQRLNAVSSRRHRINLNIHRSLGSWLQTH